jgi:predicted transposase YbfD/YdcC
VKSSGNEGIFQVKGNQKTLLKNVQQIIVDQSPLESAKSHDKAHGRIEYRKASVYGFSNPGVSPDPEWQKSILCIIQVFRQREVFDTKEKCWKTTKENSFYISTVVLSAEVFLQAIRAHWGVENKNHYVRDVTMNEDASRIRKSPENFAKLRTIALNTMRKNKDSNISLQMFKNSLNLKKLLHNYSFIL